MKKELRTIKLIEIEVSDRARADYGDIEGLMTSIKERKVGLIQPVLVSKNPREGGRPYLLEAGGRRFKSHELIGAESIEAIYCPEVLTDEERKRIELEENTKRKNLAWHEETELTRKIHALGTELAKIEGKDKVTQGETAKLMGKTQASVSRDLELAEAMDIIPELKKCETKKDAVKLLERTKEKLLAQRLATLKDDEVRTTDISKLRANIKRCYIVRDFFEGIKDVKNEGLDFVEIDPDYGIDYKKIMKDSAGGDQHYAADYNEFSPQEYEKLIEVVAAECYRVLKPDTWCICWHSYTLTAITAAALTKAGFEVKTFPLIWAKPGTSRTMFPEHTFKVDYEVILYARKGNAMLVKQAPSSIFSFATPKERIHPTEKPVALLEEIFACFVDPGATMMSAFLGSGNSIFAATNVGVKCFGFDLSMAYKNDFGMRAEEWTPKGAKVEAAVGKQPGKISKSLLDTV